MKLKTDKTKTALTLEAFRGLQNHSWNNCYVILNHNKSMKVIILLTLTLKKVNILLIFNIWCIHLNLICKS